MKIAALASLLAVAIAAPTERVGQQVLAVEKAKKQDPAADATMQEEANAEIAERVAVEAAETGGAAPPKGDKPSDVVPDMSTTNFCVISLLAQFFGLYTVLVVVRQYNLMTGNGAAGFQKILEDCTATVNLAPMLCVLFIATRYRAMQISNGEADAMGLPQPLVKTSMQICTWGVLAQFALCLFRSFLSTFLPEGAIGLMGLRYLCILAVLGGVGTVCYGLVDMHAADGTTVAVSTAIDCVMILCVLYFITVIALEVARSVRQMSVGETVSAEDTSLSGKVEGALDMANRNMVQAPMIALLFLACRMQHLQIGLPGPSDTMQVIFQVVTYSLLSGAVLTLLVPLLFGGKVRRGICDGDVVFEMQGGMAGLFALLGHLLTFAVYGGFIYIAFTMMTLSNPALETQPSLSTAASCILILVFVHFLAHGLAYVALAVKTFFGAELFGLVQKTINGASAATATVMFNAMLSVLFIAARARALEVSKNQGAPQEWAQISMKVATWCVVGTTALAFLGQFLGLGIEVDKDGQIAPSKDAGAGWLKWTTSTLGLLALCGMTGGSAAVTIALFDMSPATTIPSMFF